MDLTPLIQHLPYMLRGLTVTIQLAVVSLVGSLALGTLLAMMRLSPWWWVRWPAGVYVDVLRMIPLIMVIFWFFFLLPILIGRPVAAIVAAIAALIAFNASYMAEVI